MQKFGEDRFIDALLDHCDFPTPSPLSRIFIEHLGGAMGRVPADATAFVHRAAPFDLIVIAGGFPTRRAEDNVRWARATSDAMRPFMSGAAYVNYLGPDATPRGRPVRLRPGLRTPGRIERSLRPHESLPAESDIGPTSA